jgi:hypothetical protein
MKHVFGAIRADSQISKSAMVSQTVVVEHELASVANNLLGPF